MKPATVARPSRLPNAAARIGTGSLYMLPPLPVGTYSFPVEFEDFKAFDRSGVARNADQNARADAGAALIGAPAAASNPEAFNSFSLEVLF